MSPLTLTEGQMSPEGPYEYRINGIGVPSAALQAVRENMREQGAEIFRLRAELHAVKADPVAHRAPDGTVTVDWPAGARSCLITRQLLDKLVEEQNRLRRLVAAADEFGDRHVIDLREDGWTIAHPLSCRAAGLFACEFNPAAANRPAPPGDIGRFAVSLDDGALVIGERIEREAGLE